jgi:hypothetical protein
MSTQGCNAALMQTKAASQQPAKHTSTLIPICLRMCTYATTLQDDEVVLQKLEAAIARGPLPELDALTHCTGCKACGHEGGRKSKIKNHSGAAAAVTVAAAAATAAAHPAPCCFAKIHSLC